MREGNTETGLSGSLPLSKLFSFAPTRGLVTPVWSKSFFSGEKKANVWENLHPWGKITAAAPALKRSYWPQSGTLEGTEQRTKTLFSSGGFGQRRGRREGEGEEKNQYLGVAVRGDGEGGGGS